MAIFTHAVQPSEQVMRMKCQKFRLSLCLLSFLGLSLVCFSAAPGTKIQAAEVATVELSAYEASYQWARLTGTLSSLRLVEEVGFRYHLAGGFIYEEKYIRIETATNPFVAFIYLDLSGDKEYIAEAYYVNTRGQTIYSDPPVRITRNVLPECNTVVSQIRDTSVHVNLTINTVDNQLSEVNYVLYQEMHHRRTVTLGTDIIDIMTYSFDITGLTPDSEYLFRPSYVLPDGTEIKCESITWTTLQTSQVSPTPAPTPTSAPTLSPAPTPTASLAPTSTTAPTSALTPTSVSTVTHAATPTTAVVTEETTGQTTPGSTTSQATTMGSETTKATTEQIDADPSGAPSSATTQTTTDPMSLDEAGESGRNDWSDRFDTILLVILSVITITVVVIIVLLIIGKAKKIW